MTQQDFTDAFILWLSGAAKVNGQEIEWEDKEYDRTVHIEFPTNSPTYAVVRFKHKGRVFWRYEYVNGIMHGHCVGYKRSGELLCEITYDKGNRVEDIKWH